MVKVVECENELQLSYLEPMTIDEIMSEVTTVADIIDFLISAGVIPDEPYIFQLIESKYGKNRIKRINR